LPSLAFSERLRVATYNLENYNLTDRMTPDGYSRNAPKPEKQKEALRAVILAANADVLAVQEMGDTRFVGELQRDLETEGIRYPYTVVLGGPDPHRHVAVLSKKPFAAIARHDRLETGFEILSPGERVALVNRGLLGVTLTVEGCPVRLYTVHLKSRLTRDKRDPRAEKERLAETDTIKARLIADGLAKPEELALLVGDFNDGPNSATLTRFAKFEERPFLLMLDAPDATGAIWTYRNDKKGFYDRSDYAFVTPALKPFVTRVRASDHPRTAQASDHRPVVVDLEIPKRP
jgi:endonuclease/exonuclease/phosphatase family metal-dependent hydrolase